MQATEYAVLGGSLLASMLLLLVALLFFSFRRSWAGKAGREIGPVGSSRLGVIDLAGVGLIYAFYFGNWIDASRDPIAKAISLQYLLGQIVLQFAFVGLVVGLLFRRVRLDELWGLRWARPYWCLALIFAGFVFYSVILELLWVVGFEGWVGELFRREVGPMAPIATDWYWALLGLAVVVGAPVTEEIVFRGYLYPVFKRWGGAWLAAVAVSLFFAAAHLEGAHLLPRFVLSLILIGTYEVSGTLWVPLGIHFLNNAYAFSSNFAL
jgi:membrane protease YdiL (CAAX protease family)